MDDSLKSNVLEKMITSFVSSYDEKFSKLILQISFDKFGGYELEGKDLSSDGTFKEIPLDFERYESLFDFISEYYRFSILDDEQLKEIKITVKDDYSYEVERLIF